MKTKIVLAAAVITSLCISFGFAQDMTEEKLLRDDFVLSGVDGRLIEGENGKWLFEFESAVSDGQTELQAGRQLELLDSATLEKMTEDEKTRVEGRYRLWGKVTKFEGRNFIFPVYFLGLRKFERPTPQQDETPETKKTTSINASDDILSIPDEIKAQLQTSEVLPMQEAPAALQLKQDSIFVNRIGRIVEKNGQFVFVPDGLGQGVEKFTITLLPCMNLETAAAQMRSELNSVRFSVAGILTKYKGQKYLLLQKATRAYSYGNFGR